MRVFLPVLLLSACDENAPTGSGSGPTWNSVYGECAVGSQNIVSADDLGEPLTYFVEIETVHGWIPYSLSPDSFADASLHRDEDTGLWFDCPDGASGWHVSWAQQ
jgi:hypothetical protein